MTTYYAVCDANGPISVRIEADTIDEALAIFENGDHRAWIDGASTDAEDDLGIDGSGMSEDEFDGALRATGCRPIKDLEEIAMRDHVYHVAGGWYLWEAQDNPGAIDTLAIVSEIVGDRDTITRAEMQAIMQALTDAGLDLRNGYVVGTLDLTVPRDPKAGHPQSPDAARVWANAVRGITVISVDGGGDMRDGCVRYDTPGSMHPMQHAELAFMSAERVDDEYDTAGYIQDHADRVLLVSGDPL